MTKIVIIFNWLDRICIGYKKTFKLLKHKKIKKFYFWKNFHKLLKLRSLCKFLIKISLQSQRPISRILQDILGKT